MLLIGFTLVSTNSSTASAAWSCSKFLNSIGGRIPWLASKYYEYSIDIEFIDRQSGKSVLRVPYLEELHLSQGSSANISVPLNYFDPIRFNKPSTRWLMIEVRPGKAYWRTGKASVAVYEGEDDEASEQNFRGSSHVSNEGISTFYTPALENYELRIQTAWIRKAP